MFKTNQNSSYKEDLYSLKMATKLGRCGIFIHKL